MKNISNIKCTFLFLALTFNAGILYAQDEIKEETTSAEDIAKELANLNNTLGQMALQWDFVNYQGTLLSTGLEDICPT